MTDDGIYAVGYKLEINELSALQTVGVTFAWAVQSSEGLTITAPRRWRCRLPNPAEYVDTYFGTSEIKGILGGVAQPLLAAQSESVERVLGDALTVAFAEIMDWGGPKASTVMILGPAFPKVLGRFMSLRPPKDTGIFWITPVSVPPAIEHMWHLLLPLQVGTGSAMAWSNEVLLNHFAYPDAEHPTYWVQFVDTREVKDRIGAISKVLALPTIRKECLSGTGRETNMLQGVDLPRQLRLALDVAETEGAVEMPTEAHGGAKLLRLTQGPPLEYLSEIPGRRVQIYQWNPEAFNREKA